uniref:hypothetical protein n=1 Tax=Alistipes sp. Marseille-P5061 TaxID=2048242 RepID=UPI00131A4481|nr:hypothetical protein [Alistipes sp. Marseille-P5061]
MELSDEQILEAIRGQYKLSFMQIELSFPIKYNLATDESDEYSDKDFATFVHEYIHYLQNISTPWGLYNSMIKYEKISYDFAYLQTRKECRPPIKVTYPDSLNRKNIRQLISLGRWCRFDNKIVVDESQLITISEKLISYQGIRMPMKIISFTDQEGIQYQVPLGAWVIMETMAAIFQEFIDPSSKNNHSDVPYNIVSKFVKKNYPDIFKEKGKLVALLYSSLFSTNPGILFVDRLEYANSNQSRTAAQLFDDLVNMASIHTETEDMNVHTFYNNIEKKFSNILQKLLMINLDYVAEILKRVNINNGFVPIVTIISDGIFDRERAKSLVSYLGIPYVYSKLGGVLYPDSIKQPGKAADDIIALIGARALSYIMNNGKCELSFSCDKGENTKPECKTIPWKGAECPITAFYKIINGETIE